MNTTDINRHPLVRQARTAGFDISIEIKVEVREPLWEGDARTTVEFATVDVTHVRGGNGLCDEHFVIYLGRRLGGSCPGFWKFYSMLDFGTFRKTLTYKNLRKASIALSVGAPRFVQRVG